MLLAKLSRYPINNRQITDTAAYTLIRSKRKTLTLIVRPDGALLVRAPLRLARTRIDAFVAEKAAWIRARQQAVRTTPAVKQYVNGEEFLFLGQACKLELVPPNTAGPAPAIPSKRQDGKPTLELEGGEFRLAGTARLDGTAGEMLFTAWYKQQAHWVLAERVEWFTARCKFTYTQVRISSARTRWGSCSSRGSLSFTWRLVMAPLEVVDYVVVHELAHLRVRNHSPAFWKEVETILPDYKARQKWLKTNGRLLTLS